MCIDLHFDLAMRPLGTFSLWSDTPGPVRARPDGEPRREDEGVPPGYLQVGPLLDDGAVPFRAWSEVAFERRLFRLLNGEVGVGLIPTLFVSPQLVAGGRVVGVNGTVSLDGQLTLRFARTTETVPLRWNRGIDALDPAAGRHATNAEGRAEVEAEGQYLGYRWSFRGTIAYDLHLYTASGSD